MLFIKWMFTFAGNLLQIMYKHLLNILFILLSSLFLLPACGERQQEVQEWFERAGRWEEANHPDSALMAYRQILHLLENADGNREKGEAHLAAGNILFRHSLDAEALSEYEKALDCGKHLTDKTLLSKTQRAIGKYYLSAGRMQQSSDSIRQGKEIIMSSLQLLSQVDKDEKALIYNNVGFIHRMNGNCRRALLYYSMSDACCADSVLWYKNAVSKGNAFQGLGDFRRSIPLFLQALGSPEVATQASACVGLVRAFEHLGDLSRSNFYHRLLQEKKDRLVLEKKTDAVARIWGQEDAGDALFPSWGWVLAGCLVAVVLAFLFVKGRSKMAKGTDVADNDGASSADEAGGEEETVCLVAQFYATEMGAKVRKIQDEDLSAKPGKPLRHCLAAKNYALLVQTVQDVFSAYCQKIRSFYPDIAAKDLVYCCLSGLLKLNTRCCAACLNLSPDSVRTNKMRIKRKLCATAEGEALFKAIFS